MLMYVKLVLDNVILEREAVSVAILFAYCTIFSVMEKGGAFSVSLTKDAVTQRNSNCYPWQNCIFLKGLGAFNVACLFIMQPQTLIFLSS